MELFKLLGTIAIENAEAKKALSEVSQEGGKTESKLSKAFGVIGKGAAVCGKAVAVGLAAGATAMTGLTVKALQLSGDLEQNMGGAEAVFGELGKTIGDMETPMQRYDAATGKVITETSNLETVSKEAFKNMGLSQSDYLATANKMGALFKGAGFETQEALDLSSQAMQRAADVASIMGIDTEAAMEAVAGAAKGNFTMMDNLGVAMNDTAIQNYALEKGINKTTAEMTQQEKIGLAMEMFMEKTAYAAGNYAKENETLAGSLSTAKSALTNFLAGSGDVDSLVSSFSNLANVVVNSLGEIVPRLTTGLTDIVNQVAPMLPGLLNQLLPVIVQGATSLVNGLVTALPGIVSAITAALPALVQGVLQLITNLAAAIPQIIQPIIAAIPLVMDAIISALPTLIPALITGTIQLIMGIVQAISQIVMPLVEALPQIVVLIVQALIQNLPAIIEGLIQLIMGIVAALPQIIQAIVDALPTIIQMIIEGLLTNLPAIIMGLIQVVIGIVAALPEILGSLITAIPEALKGIWDGISNVFSGLGEWFGNTFSGAKDAAVNAWNGAKELFSGVKDKVVGAFQTMGDDFKNKFTAAKNLATKAWDGIKNTFSGIKDKVVGAFSSLGNDMNNKFAAAKNLATKAWDGIKNTFSGIKDKVVGAFSNLGSNLKEKFNSAKDKALTAFSNIKDKVLSVGKNLVEGIWNGISNGLSWIKNKIKGWVGSVTDFCKKLLGIKSPSTVFRDEIGRYIAQGVAVGIEENTGDVENAVEEMNKKILDAAQKRLDDYKVYNELTLADEVAYWDEVRKQVEEGSDARLQADQKYLDAKKSLDEQIAESSRTLYDKIAEADEKLASRLEANDQRITERAKNLEGTFGVFDPAKLDGSATDVEMFYNLNSQVKALELYGAEIDELRAKLEGHPLLEEIESMGVDVLKQIQILNDMEDSALNHYLDMYDKRSELAKDIAYSELQNEHAAEESAAYAEYAEAEQLAYAEHVDEMNKFGVQIVADTEAMKVGAIDNFRTMLDTISKAFEEWKPKLKLPHFKIEGNLDLEAGTVPTISVEWYKKAMNNAMLLEKPTIFGFNNASGKLMGGGEAGSEVVAGSTTLMNMIQNAVAEQNGTLNYYLQKIVELLATFFPEQIESFRNMKLQLNTGALVGELVGPMDEALGILSRRKDRGI